MIAALTVALAMMPDTGNVLTDGGFARGLAPWRAEGAARFDPTVGDGAVRLGPGSGAVRMRLRMPGLHVLWFGATLIPSAPGAKPVLRLRCLDAKGRLVMELESQPDPKTGLAAVYLKTQARTASVELSIESTGESGETVADDAILRDDDRDRLARRPLVNFDQATKPFWVGTRIEDESVLLLSQGGASPNGRLLFAPRRIISVRDPERGITFAEGRDYTLRGDTLTAVAGAAIPTFSDAELATGEYPWTPLQGRHLAVTYEHGGTWHGPVPTFQGALLPATMRRLRARRPLSVVAYGDSITLGMSGSAYRAVPPYLPAWPALFARAVGRSYGAKITVTNAALGGANSYWGRDNARDAVGALAPDLVLIAFGMNDFWSLSPTEFRANIDATMAAIRARSPGCEFLLIAPMRFDPAYTAEATYVGNLAGYATELDRLTGPGVAFLDMTAVTDALYVLKGAKSLTADPMHPNDFLTRIYAQGAATTLLPPKLER